jgi:hypothetical protein
MALNLMSRGDITRFFPFFPRVLHNPKQLFSSYGEKEGQLESTGFLLTTTSVEDRCLLISAKKNSVDIEMMETNIQAENSGITKTLLSLRT